MSSAYTTHLHSTRSPIAIYRLPLHSHLTLKYSITFIQINDLRRFMSMVMFSNLRLRVSLIYLTDNFIPCSVCTGRKGIARIYSIKLHVKHIWFNWKIALCPSIYKNINDIIHIVHKILWHILHFRISLKYLRSSFK